MPKYKSPVIYLFKENIDDYAAERQVLPDYVFGFVYVHEAMHAYYDSKNNSGYLSVTELEEAFAEFGMLDFFYNTNLGNEPGSLLETAYEDVKSKQSSISLSHYGFGAEMLDIALSRKDVPAKMMADYRKISNWIDVQRKAVQDYRNEVSLLIRGSVVNYAGKAQNCYDYVMTILNTKFTKPKVSALDIESRAKRENDKKKEEERISRRLPEDKIYTGLDSQKVLVPFFASASLDYVVYALATFCNRCLKIIEIPEPYNKENVGCGAFKMPKRRDPEKISAEAGLNDVRKTVFQGLFRASYGDKCLALPDGTITDIRCGWHLGTNQDDPVNDIRKSLSDILLLTGKHFFIKDRGYGYVLYGEEELLPEFQKILPYFSDSLKPSQP